MSCENPVECADILNCAEQDGKLCNTSFMNIVGLDNETYKTVLCNMFGYWELPKNSLFFSYLGDNNTKINSQINNQQRKNFLKMVNKVYKFGYNNDSRDDKKYSSFYLKITDKYDKSTKTINLVIGDRLNDYMICSSTQPDSSRALYGYQNNVLLNMRILDNNFNVTEKYFYIGLRTIDGQTVLNFDGSTIPNEITACDNPNSCQDMFTVNDLQEIGIPIFYFSENVNLNHQSIYLQRFSSGSAELSPSRLVDIENAKKKAENACVKQFNRLNLLDPNCKCINTNNMSNIEQCNNRTQLGDETITLPKYCTYLSNSDNSFQRGISACQTAAYNTYEEEIRNLNSENDSAYDRWLNSETNDNNSRSVSLEISNKYKDINNELMTKCPMMKLGLNGVVNSEIIDNVINDSNVNSVINKYIENKDELGLDVNYNPDLQQDNINVNNEYYSNIHPLSDCKYDSYKLMERICQDYSLPTDDDPLAYVLPRKCNITDLKYLLEECNTKNLQEVPGSDPENILERILPYNLETEEGVSGKCNAVKMDTLGIDSTINTWSNMWRDHNASVNRIGQVVRDTLNMESEYFTKKRNLSEFYENSLINLDVINQKKNCALLGRTYTGVPNNPPDGTNCGPNLESHYKQLFIKKSLPVCMYSRNKFTLDYEKKMSYLKMGIGLLILFLIIYLLSKKMTN